MKSVYLIGGVGAGKSTVLDILKKDYGAGIIQADEVARELMQPGKIGHRQVVAAMGTTFLRPDGSIDRQKMAEEVFSNRDAIGMMNAIIHPLVWDRIRFMMDHSDRELTVVEAAIYDAPHRPWFDEVWYVYADISTRLHRLMESRGYSDEKCHEIMSNQRSDADFRRVADHVIDNSATLDDVRRQLEEILGK